MFTPRARWLVGPLAWCCLACPSKDPLPPPPPERCEVDLAQTGLFSRVGNSARARLIETGEDLIGGPFAQGTVGDFLLENDKLRVVIQRPLRDIGPLPYGGALIDADRRRPQGSGRDQFGKLSPFFAFGRVANVSRVEVLDDGASGGPAVIAATGEDAVDDFLNVERVIDSYLGSSVKLVVSPERSFNLLVTTYFVLSPGESRVRLLTAFCNRTSDNVVIPVGELLDQGGTTDFFNPDGCANGMGTGGCLIDPTSWFGYQGDDVAYGWRGYRFSDPTVPEPKSALLNVGGVSVVVSGGESQQAMLSWTDPQAAKRPGSFGVLAHQQRSFLRDFYVGRDLGDITSQQLLNEPQKARLSVIVRDQAGSLAPGARVAVTSSITDRQLTLLVADADGKARADLPPGTYRLVAALLGHALPSPVDAVLGSGGTAEVALQLGASRTLTVAARNGLAEAIPGKIVLMCPAGCPVPVERYRPFFDVEPLPTGIATVAFIPPQGTTQVRIPPGQYELLVSRGPEHSGWPDSYPLAGDVVDLTSADAAREAVIGRVVDSTGWMSADLHVHAVNSADSSVANEQRVLSFLADGVDVLVATDHDHVTDYAPHVQALGAERFLKTVVGCEVTPFDFGHHQAFPIVRGDSPNGGAFDWAGGDGPTLRPSQLYEGLRERFPGVVLQMNHPRSGLMGSLSQLRVDTATGASHAHPEPLRMEPAPGASDSDTRLFSFNFDALEVQNGPTASTAVLNDWMTFLSRGSVKTATAVSDTHHAFTAAGGFSRTFVEVGVDHPSQLDVAHFAQALRAQRATGTNGPFLKVTARRLEAAGQPDPAGRSVGETVSIQGSAGEKVELTVEVQAPHWMAFDTIELFTHAAGREAMNGVANTSWPASRIHASKRLDPSALPIVAVAEGSRAFRRIQVLERFTVAPTSDTWYVVVVRGQSTTRSLYPSAWSGVSCDASGLCVAESARPFAFSNAILVDADGSGAYDRFPLSQGLVAQPPAPRPAQARRVPTNDELSAFLRAVLDHHHEP